jgi:hypothetical protein
MSEGEKRENQSIQSWAAISGAMLGVELTILTLIWQFSPKEGIITTSFLLLCSFPLFVNSMTVNAKIIYEQGQGTEKKYIEQWTKFAEYSFGLGFTLVIVAFAIFGYKILMEYTFGAIVSLLLPIAFIAVIWVILLIYNALNVPGKRFKYFRSWKRNIWILTELIGLIFIGLDYFNILTLV